MDTTQRYASFAEFYPFYLGEHAHPVCRRLHVVGSTLVLAIIVAVITRIVSPWALLALPLVGYGFAWIGHFYFEKNKPATFKYPHCAARAARSISPASSASEDRKSVV